MAATDNSITITEQFLAKIAGWDVLKQARSVVAGGRVLSSDWSPPVLKGVVQEGTTSYRAGLVIKDSINIDNLCTCRTAKAWGAMCVHSTAVGLHHSQKTNRPIPSPSATKAKLPPPKDGAKVDRTVKRVKRSADGLEAEIALIFPPNFSQAIGKGKVMLYAEALTSSGRVPLNTLTSGQSYKFDDHDVRLLEELERIGGDTPAM